MTLLSYLLILFFFIMTTIICSTPIQMFLFEIFFGVVLVLIGFDSGFTSMVIGLILGDIISLVSLIWLFFDFRKKDKEFSLSKPFYTSDDRESFRELLHHIITNRKIKKSKP